MSCGSSKFIEVESSEIDLYGDIFLLKKKKTKFSDFCTIEYAEINDHFNNTLDYYNDEDIVYYEDKKNNENNDIIKKTNSLQLNGDISKPYEKENENLENLLDIDNNDYYQ